MPQLSKISPCLWFDGQAEEAARYYTSIFRNSKILKTGRYGEAGKDMHGRPPGSVMMVLFELDGQTLTALNGGPIFRFNEAVSLQVDCADQAEVDYFWEKLGAGGDESAQQCGWLKDRYGLSWQVVPNLLSDLVSDPESEKSQRAMLSMMKMKKIDIAELERAYAGPPERAARSK